MDLAASPSDTPTRAYSVQLVAIDADGSEVDSTSARWTSRLLSRTEPDPAHFLSSDGDPVTFEARPGDRFEVLVAWMGERMLVPRERSIELADERDILLDADLPEYGELRVIDAETGADIQSVHIVPWTCSEQATTVPPRVAQGEACLRTFPSPVALPANQVHRSYWIGAPDYAWKRVQYGAASGATIHTLRRGGALRLDVSPPRGNRATLVARVHDEAGTALAEEPLSGEPLIVSGLPCGPARALIVATWPETPAGDRPRGELVLAEASTTVSPGQTSLAFDLSAHDVPWQRGTLVFRLSLQDPADEEALQVHVERLGNGPAERATLKANALRRHEGYLAGGFRDRSAGTHRITVPPSSAEAVVEVAGEAQVEAFLDVPSLPKLRLMTIDESSGEPIANATIAWRSADSEDPGSWRVATGTTEPGIRRFPVAWGPVDVAVQAPGYRSVRERFTLIEPVIEHYLELAPVDPRRILVRLRMDAHSAPVPIEEWGSIRVTDASGRDALIRVSHTQRTGPTDFSGNSAMALLEVDGPGSYSITLGPLTDYLVEGPTTVVVDTQQAEVDIELSHPFASSHR